MFTIINKQTKEFFAGFKGGKVSFTSNKSKAWAGTAQQAKLQASCLISGQVNVQRKPVAL
jgi:hypothetical protein